MQQYQTDPPCPQCGAPGCICSDDAEAGQGCQTCTCGRRSFCNDSYCGDCAAWLPSTQMERTFLVISFYNFSEAEVESLEELEELILQKNPLFQPSLHTSTKSVAEALNQAEAKGNDWSVYEVIDGKPERRSIIGKCDPSTKKFVDIDIHEHEKRARENDCQGGKRGSDST